RRPQGRPDAAVGRDAERRISCRLASWRLAGRAWLDCLATDGVDPSTAGFQAGCKCSGRQARKHERGNVTDRKDDPAFIYFPTNYRWSMGLLLCLSAAPWGGAEIDEVNRVGRALRDKIGDDNAWFE